MVEGNMKRRTVIVLLLFALIVPVALAAPSVKPPWQWTNAERIAARSDVSAAAARVEAYTAKTGAASHARTQAVQGAPAPADIIEGNVHPELFLPTELFRHFVLVAFVMRPQNYAQIVAESSTDLFRTPEELARLDALATPYTATLQRERDLLQERASARGRAAADIESDLRATRTEQCHALASVLRSARQQFGADRFNQFLYEVATRNLMLTSESAPSSSDHMTPYLRNAVRIEEECQ
jgi:hypothetical protein